MLAVECHTGEAHQELRGRAMAPATTEDRSGAPAMVSAAPVTSGEAPATKMLRATLRFGWDAARSSGRARMGGSLAMVDGGVRHQWFRGNRGIGEGLVVWEGSGG